METAEGKEASYGNGVDVNLAGFAVKRSECWLGRHLPGCALRPGVRPITAKRIQGVQANDKGYDAKNQGQTFMGPRYRANGGHQRD